MGVSSCVHLITKTALVLRDDNEVDDEIGLKVTFKNLLLKVFCFAVRQNQESGSIANNCVSSGNSFVNLFS
jgi:hypothetical protein